MNLFINLNFIQEIPCSKQVRDMNLDCSSTQIHNHLVCKRTLRHLTKKADLAKWLSVRLQTKWL